MLLHAVVEGDLEVAFLPVMFEQLGLEDLKLRVTNSRGAFWPEARRFNRLARTQHVVALADLERGFCASKLLADELPDKYGNFHLRIAVRMLESWLLADRVGIASFLGVAESRIPQRPDDLENPKRQIGVLAAGSRSKTIRERVAPGDSGGVVGREYAPAMKEFVTRRWSLEPARAVSPSLDRAARRWMVLC
jgi:hypothetical protein